MKPLFRVAVTGDTGYDIYTEYVEGYESDDRRVRKPEVAYDTYVPSGAAFTALAFETLLNNSHARKITVKHLLPTQAFKDRKAGKEFSTLQKFLLELERVKSDPPKTGGHALRVRRARPIVDKDEPRDSSVFKHLVGEDGKDESDSNFHLLVIHDGAGSWRKYPATASGPTGDAMQLVEHVLSSKNTAYSNKDNPQGPRIIVNLNHDLPDIIRGAGGDLTYPTDQFFWHKLLENSDKVCVICSVNMLRREGAAISRRLSWEQTIEDLASDLHLFDKLKMLSRFKHLIIRFGMVGAVHVMSDGLKRYADLVFAPLAPSGIYRDPVEHGMIEGQNAFLAAALTRMIASQKNGDCIRPAFVEAMKSGLQACMRAFDHGYTIKWKNDGGESSLTGGESLIRRLLQSGDAESAASCIAGGYDPSKTGEKGCQILGEAVVPCDILERPQGGLLDRLSDWELLRNGINRPCELQTIGGVVQPNRERISRINVGVAIVLFGQNRVLNHHWKRQDEDDEKVLNVLYRPELSASPDEIGDHITLPAGKKPTLPSSSLTGNILITGPVEPMYTPVLSFGQMTVVERKEIEGIRSIHNLVKNYHHEQGERANPSGPPISIAVFGPPGSGKSFAVKEIAHDINRSLRHPKHGVEPLEYNVSQFRSVEELGDAITRASSVNNDGKTPLVFFDEFDCEFGGNPLGWLKYFLAPMQDGMFYGVRQTVKIARAIFVFAGGVHHNFDAFDPSTNTIPPSSHHELDEKERRHSLFREQKGPDFVSRLRGHINILPVSADNGAVKPIIRRAIVLRGLLAKLGLIVKGRTNELAYVDEDIIYALLTMDRYRHGARSMEAILQMCTKVDGKIEKVSLPSRGQINMHVDADEFFIRMYRGRFRPHYAPPQDPTPSIPPVLPPSPPVTIIPVLPPTPPVTDDLKHSGPLQPVTEPVVNDGTTLGKSKGG